MEDDGDLEVDPLESGWERTRARSTTEKGTRGGQNPCGTHV
jgi:hypothetical protein